MRTICSLVLLAACIDRPTPLVLCHNSNCAEPQSNLDDDTVAAMRSSLALVAGDGETLIDGIELDLLRHDGQCLFAHDDDHVAGHVDIRDGAAVVAEHLMTHPIASHNREQFNVKLELKPQVDGRNEPDEQVTCALDVYELLRQAALASGHDVELVFDSYEPALLSAVSARRPPDEAAIWTRLSIDFGVPPLLRSDNYLLSEIDVPIDIAEFHGSWITDTALRALRSMNVDFTVWSFDLTRETLADVERIDPKYVLTGQAETMRAWLDY